MGSGQGQRGLFWERGRMVGKRQITAEGGWCVELKE